MPTAPASICKSRATVKTHSQSPGFFASPFAAAPAKWGSVRSRLFGLAEARAKAAECRRQTYEGIDPIEARRAQRVQAALEAATALTFEDCAEQYIAAHSAGWRNAKHAAQWSSTLKTYAEPVIGALAVQSIDTALVMKVIEPFGRRSRKRPRGCAAGSKPCSIGRRCAASARAKIRRDGAAISTSCCRRAPRYARSSTMLPCL